MNIRELQVEGAMDASIGYHMLIVAEVGFSMLDLYANHQYGLDGQDIHLFANTVNHKNEAGTLYPRAPISAVPRKYLRGEDLPEGIYEHIVDFLKANVKVIKAKKVAFDFRVSAAPVPLKAIEACKQALTIDEAGILENVIIIL